MSLEDLVGRLRTGAEAVGGGRLRIDGAKALAKLRDFRLARSQDFTLELLRAAVVSGATRVEVRIDLDEHEVVFDGEPFPPGLLRDLFGCALSGGGDVDLLRGRLLAFGVLGALALGPRLVEVRGSGLVVRVRPPSRIEVAEDASATGTTRVHVRRGLGWRVVKWPFQAEWEKDAVAKRTHHFPATLTLNGEPCHATAFPGEGRLLALERHEDGRDLLLGVPEAPDWHGRQAEIEIALHGVSVVRRGLDVGAIPVVGWGRDDRLRRDVSGADVVVDDAAFLELATAVEAAADELLDGLVAMLEGPEADRVRPLLQAAAARVESGFHKASRHARQRLDAAPLLQGPAGERLSLAELRRAGRPLRVSKRPWSADLYDPPVVLLGRAPVLEAALTGERREIWSSVQERLRRQRNRARFEAQAPEPPELPHGEWIARGSVEADGIRGEVGIAADGVASFVRFLLGGRLLEHQEVASLAPLRVTAVVDGTSLAPDEAWLGVAEDEAYRAAVEAVRVAAVESVCRVVEAGTANPAVRQHGRDALAALAGLGRPLPEVLRAAPLFDLAGEGHTSLDTLDRQTSVRYVPRPWPHPPLDGFPVVVLADEHLPLFSARQGSPRPRDFTERLHREFEVRQRLAGPRETPSLPSLVAVKRRVAAGCGEGEIGVSESDGPGLHVTLLRDGVRLARRRLDTDYGSLAAAIDAPALQPTPAWDSVADDEAYAEVVAALRGYEPLLIEAVVERYPRAPLHALPSGAREYAWRFLERHLAPDAEPARGDLRRACEAARAGVYLTTSSGRRSLLEVLDAVAASGRLFVLPPEDAARLPRELPVVVADAGTARVLARLSRLGVEAPWEELERLRARAVFARLPTRTARLEDGVEPRVAVDADGFHGELGWAGPDASGIRVEVLHTSRLLCVAGVESALPLRAVVDVESEAVDPAELSLPADVGRRLNDILAAAERRLVASALETPDAPGCRALLLCALASGFAQVGAGLRRAPLFRTTTGQEVSLADLERRKTISYVSEPLEGGLANGEPVVLAVDPAVRAALAASDRRRRNVGEGLAAQIAARLERQELPTVDEIRVAGGARWRRAFADGEVEGEVVLTGRGAAGLEVYHRHRRLGREELPAPDGVQAALNCDALRPRARSKGVRRDATFKRVVERVLDEVEALASDVAREWPALTGRDQDALRRTLVALVGWIAGRGRGEHPCFELELFAAADGGALSFAELAAAQSRNGHVRVSIAEGELIDPAERIWVPRPREREALAGVVDLLDVTAAVSWARLVRARPLLDGPSVEGGGSWREPVVGDGLEGEVVLGPPGSLSVELVRERRLLETLSQEHPIGARARVDALRLRGDPARGGVARDPAFQAARGAVEAAIERVLARLLGEGSPGEREAWLARAIAWRFGRGGPVDEALAGVPAFEAATGSEPVTLGRVLAEASERGSVAILEAGLALTDPPARLVLRVGPAARGLLGQLRVRTEDLSEVARREQARARRIEQRRLSRLRYDGQVLLRLPVESGGWSGELALPDPPDRSAAIQLARDRVAIDRLHAGDLGVAGVLDHPELPVDAEWTRSLLDESWRDAIGDLVDGLFARMAELVGPMDPLQRETAAVYALRRLSRAGVAACDQLDRLTPADDALARAPVLPTADDRHVDVRTVASHVVQSGPVPLLCYRGARFSGDGLVLRALPGAAWADLLESVLGSGSLRRFDAAAAWELHAAEREPAPSDPLHAGMQRLRHEASWLRGSALGALSADVLRDVKLHRGGGRTPVRYEAQRGLALVDPEHPAVARALRDAADDEALFVLVAAIYGAVNRALDAVTDEDETHLITALLQRLSEPASAG